MTEKRTPQKPELSAASSADDLYSNARRENYSAETNDLLRLYLNSIGRVALLTASEEVELSKDIEAGLYAKQLLAGDSSASETQYDERDLSELARIGEDAKQHMLEANLRLSMSIAKKYQRKGLDLLDLTQEGNLGLVRAVEKFDYKKGFKFSTYATWWVKQSITRAIADQSRTIRLPVHTVEKVNKLHRIERELLDKLGRYPTDDEVCGEMDVTADKLQELRGYARDTMSLDAPLGNGSSDDPAALGDFLANSGDSDPDMAAVEGGLRDDLVGLLGSGILSDREKRVIMLRFGMVTGAPQTLDQIGLQLGVTRERVRQIEFGAMKKLRSAPATEHLKEYI